MSGIDRRKFLSLGLGCGAALASLSPLKVLGESKSSNVQIEWEIRNTGIYTERSWQNAIKEVFPAESYSRYTAFIQSLWESGVVKKRDFSTDGLGNWKSTFVISSAIHIPEVLDEWTRISDKLRRSDTFSDCQLTSISLIQEDGSVVEARPHQLQS